MTAAALRRALEERLKKRESESEQTRGLVAVLVTRDPGASIKINELRQMLLFASGRRITDAELVWAVACAVGTARARRPWSPRERQRERLIDGCRWKHGSPKAILRTLSLHARPSYLARAARYFRSNNWAEFPKQDRSIFEAWAVFGRLPSRIAFDLGLTEETVSASLTFHRARSGITRSDHQ